MHLKNLALFLALSAVLRGADHHAVVPKNGVPPIGPYSAGVFAGDYLYMSGQGAKKPDGEMTATFEEQAKQTLENVKTVVEAAGLSMKNVVYTQVYLVDITHSQAMNRVDAEYFRGTPPARATLGVAALSGGTSIEINAVAIRDEAEKKAVFVKGYITDEPLSPGILTKDRLFISALHVTDLQVSNTDPEKQVGRALAGMKSVVQAAGLRMDNVVFVNPYLTSNVPMKVLNAIYARQFHFGNTPARATIEVTALPRNSAIEFTGVAVRDANRRAAIRPKNMPLSATASPCVFAGDTLYCSAKSGFIPGSNGGVFTPSVDLQVRQTMRNLLDNLEEAGLSFEDVVATNVYLDSLDDFATMNRIYAKYLTGIFPARTTIQQIAPGDRNKKADDSYPAVEQISLIAVKPKVK